MRVPAALLKEFILSLSGKAGTTVDGSQRELRNSWIGSRSALETAARSRARRALMGYASGSGGSVTRPGSRGFFDSLQRLLP